MANHLANETSPYLLQHAENPVDWYPWGPAALEIAGQEDKPIFLSIGYAACHWCHVMEKESFTDPETARLLNEHFVCIKVDREERPDLDALYMNAVVSMTGQGGWPMSVFLTPEQKPFFAGTYFPPQPRYGMPSFTQVLEAIIRSWRDERENLHAVSEEITAHLKKDTEWSASTQAISPKTLETASQKLISSYDWENGGWGQPPKFPMAMAIDFLLARATRGEEQCLDVASHALQSMIRGGMYDVVGGGFHRYSTDAEWLIPHFEKMLYDNALLARAYLHAYLLTGNINFRRVCLETLDFTLRDLTSPEGGFYSSLDADSEGEEGKYYLWTPADIQRALEEPDIIEFYCRAYGITESGNFEGQTILQRALTDEQIADEQSISPEEVQKRVEKYRQQLLYYRSKRTRPSLDDKVLTAWNSLAQVAFAEAGLYLDRPDYTDIAVRNAMFLTTNLLVDGRLKRSWRAGQAHQDAFLEDHAALILALLTTYQASFDLRWYHLAEKLLNEMLAHFTDPAGGFFDTRDDQENLLTRPKEVQDNATPSGNSLAAMALMKMHEYTGDAKLWERAERSLGAIQSDCARYPSAFAYWLTGLDFYQGPIRQIVITGLPENPRTRSLIKSVYSTFRPRMVCAVSGFPPPETSPQLVQDRPMKDRQPTAYVCEGFVCKLPVTDAQSLDEMLS